MKFCCNRPSGFRGEVVEIVNRRTTTEPANAITPGSGEFKKQDFSWLHYTHFNDQGPVVQNSRRR